MIDVMIRAENECTDKEDIHPDKVLRPIGFTFKEWVDELCSTDIPHWMWWKIVGHIEAFVGRRGDVLLYERNEAIELM